MRAAGLLPGLLLIASIAPAARASNPTGPAGGASRAVATALKNKVSYGGQVAPGQQAWYKLNPEQGERVSVRLSGRTQLCPVRMTLIDARGLGLGEIVSTTRELEPFIVYYPGDETSSDSYLRVQQGPSAALCASAAYLFTLQEPEQLEPIQCKIGPDMKPEPCASPAKESAVPTYEARACAAASRNYRKLESELARERSGSARRRLEVEISAARRAVIHGCRY